MRIADPTTAASMNDMEKDNVIREIKLKYGQE